VSRYAKLVCEECRVQLWLGKAVFAEGGEVRTFHAGAESKPPMWQREPYNQVVWKLFALHARHTLRVVIEGDAAYDAAAEFAEIGGEGASGISFERFLR
jgi:hypothetical protein